MNPKKLSSLFSTSKGKVSDKWQSYLDVYDESFRPFRAKPIRLLEIGVQNGGSLEIWSRFFPNAKQFVGCDIDKKCQELSFDDERISVVVADANSDTAFDAIQNISNHYEIIIDDGSHMNGDIIHSFSRYFPLLVDGGVYVIEDLHTGYWKDFDGGLMEPQSAIEFLKRLVDLINDEHWEAQTKPEKLVEWIGNRWRVSFDEEDLLSISEVSFRNSLCFIKKSKRNRSLGKRVVSGDSASVTTAAIELAGKELSYPHKPILDWVDPVKHIEDVSKLLTETKLENLQKAKELEKIRESTSWRLILVIHGILGKFPIVLQNAIRKIMAKVF